MPTLSAALIVRNEEKLLPRCLQSLAGIDEIVVVDTGSVDSTVEVARKFTDKIHSFAWVDDFAAARNHAIERCSGDFVLSIDADEYAEPGTVERIKAALRPECPAYTVAMKAEGGCDTFWAVRAFRKDLRFEGAIHETVRVVGGASTRVEGASIVYGTSPAHSYDPDRNFRMLKREAEDRPSARAFYYFAREYWYKRDWANAAAWFEKCSALSQFPAERADAQLYLARCYWYMGRGDDARRRCMDALTVNPNFKEAALFMSQIVWPRHSGRWVSFAEGATNEEVLFVRGQAAAPVPKKTVDVVILALSKSQDLIDMTKSCIDSLLASEKEIKFNVIVVESADVGTDLYAPHLTVKPEGPFNFNRFSKAGLALAENEWQVLANNDVVFHPGWFTEILKAKASNPQFSSFCPWNPVDRWHDKLGLKGDVIEGYTVPKELIGWCIVAGREVWRSIKLDERVEFLYSDNIYGDEIREAGFRHALVRNSLVSHLCNKTFNSVPGAWGKLGAGQREKYLKAPAPRKAGIPKTIHMVWIGDESKRPDACIETWRRLNPSWTVKVWGNKELGERAWRNAAHMKEMKEPCGVADMMRYEILLDEGGFAMDADCECVRPLEDWLLEATAFSCWENELLRPGLLSVGYMGARAGDPLMKAIVEDIRSSPTVTEARAWITVGPKRLTDVWRKMSYDGLTVYPSHYFIPKHFAGPRYSGSGPVFCDQKWKSTVG